jgi:hypothetical protein
MNTRFNIALRLATVCCGVAIWSTTSRGADYYFGNWDTQPTYSMVKSYSDPNRSGWYDFQNLQTSSNTSTTIGVTTGTQSLAWQPSGVGYINGLTYNLQTDPRPAADRTATIQAMLANNHLAFNVTWDRNEWITQHNGDINSSNYSQVRLVYNFSGVSGGVNNFSTALAPDIDTGNPGFPGGWDPVNYTTPTHTRLVEFDYTPIKAQLQAAFDAGTTTGTNGFLELILVTNAASGNPGYSYPITYYLDSFRFTTPGVPGDYNNNGTVDAGDYVLWRKGGPLLNQVDDPNTVNAADYTAWRARFGNAGPGAGAGGGLSSAAVPEPATWLLVTALVGLFGLRRGSK